MSCPASKRPPGSSPASRRKSLFDYAIPYWRRLTLVLALIHGALVVTESLDRRPGRRRDIAVVGTGVGAVLLGVTLTRVMLALA